MRIEDIMTREVITAGFDDDLQRVRDLFTKFRFRHLPVVDDEGRLAGIISDRDMLANVSPFAGTINERAVDANSLRRKAHQIMTRHPMTMGPKDKAEQAVLLMLHQRISSLPVVDSQARVLGIVTMRDLMRWLLNRANIDPSRDAA